MVLCVVVLPPQDELCSNLEDMCTSPVLVQVTSARPRHPELVAQITLMLLPADARDNSVM